MSNLCIITARGGSKRIPRKNIKDFLGKPIIAYSIEVALKCEFFDEVMVSTDDAEIAEIALKYGAKVPFMRSPVNSDDFSGTADVVLEVLKDYLKTEKEFENVCCIYPTAPFVTASSLRKSLELLKNNAHDSVFPVCQFSYPIQRALQLDEDERVSMIWKENQSKRSQDLKPSYHDAGQFYWMNVESFMEGKKLFTSNSGSIVLSELEVQDIDTETDWKLAEIKYELLQNIK